MLGIWSYEISNGNYNDFNKKGLVDKTIRVQKKEISRIGLRIEYSNLINREKFKQ